MIRFDPSSDLPGTASQMGATDTTYSSPGATPHPSAPPGYEPSRPWAASAGFEHPRGTTALVLGILSVVGLSFLGPFAWVVGRKGLKEADAAPHPTTNRSTLLAGMVLGIVGTCFLAFGLVYVSVVVGVVLTAL